MSMKLELRRSDINQCISFRWGQEMGVPSWDQTPICVQNCLQSIRRQYPSLIPRGTGRELDRLHKASINAIMILE